MKALLIILFCVSNSFFTPEKSLNLSGKVIGIKDGDTIEVLVNNTPIIVRLSHIDCPEMRSGQPFAQKAKNKTSELCFGQQVTIEAEAKKDRYKRTLGVVINEKGQNVNIELVKAGLAWHFTQYSSDSSYASAEKIARSQKLAIWSQKDPIAPWQWRKPKR